MNWSGYENLVSLIYEDRDSSQTGAEAHLFMSSFNILSTSPGSVIPLVGSRPEFEFVDIVGGSSLDIFYHILTH